MKTVKRTFTINDEQEKILNLLINKGINASQLVRLGLGIVFRELDNGKTINELVYEYNKQLDGKNKKEFSGTRSEEADIRLDEGDNREYLMIPLDQLRKIE